MYSKECLSPEENAKLNFFIWESEKKILIFCFESQLYREEIYNWPFNEMSFFGQ